MTPEDGPPLHAATDSGAPPATPRPRRRRGIAVRLSVGILGITALTVATIGLAFVGLRELSDTLGTVNRETLPAVHTAGEISRLVRSIDSQVRNLPNLESPFAIDSASLRLRQSVDRLEAAVKAIDSRAVTQAEIADIKQSLGTVRRLVSRVSGLIQRQLELDWRRRRSVDDIVDLGEDVERSWLSAAGRVAGAAEVAALLRRGVNTLLSAETTLRPDRTLALRDRFDDVRADLLERLSTGDAAVIGAFPGQIERLGRLAFVFDDRLEYLENRYRTQSTLRRLAVMQRLIDRAESVADDLTTDARSQAGRLEDTVADLNRTLLAVAAIGLAVAGVLLMYSKRRIVDRMRALQKTMLLHVAGAPRPVDTGGADEITDIGQSFVHFVDEVNKRERRLQERTRELDVAATALAAKEAQLRTALDTMGDGLFMLDRDARYELYNAKYVEFLADSNVPAHMVGPGLPIYDALLAAARNGLYGAGEPEALARQRLAGFRDAADVAIEVVTPGGRWFELRKTPRAVGGSVTVLTDITERKRAQQQLADAFEQISDSINYASFIQRALLPPDRYLAEDLADFFIIWHPRDVVGGDLYWYRRCRGGFLLVLADCTGHGVPGAFMTLIATGTLDRAIRERPDGDPATVLKYMNRSVKISLGQDGPEGESDDGLELGICKIEAEPKRLIFAGARFQLFHHRDGAISEIKGDRTSIGYRAVPLLQDFTNHEIPLADGDTFYMTTDGLTDQIGGEKRRAFGKRRFADLVLAGVALPMAEQAARIVDALAAYQGEQSRRDDVTVLGFRP